MFSNLSQNSILYVLDINNSPKVLSGPVERVTMPRPKYNTFNPNMEMVVDIFATINGERREFKGALNSYINAMMQNSKSILDSVEKHQKLLVNYEEALSELNPDIKADKEKDKAIQNLQSQVAELKDMLLKMNRRENPNTL